MTTAPLSLVSRLCTALTIAVGFSALSAITVIWLNEALTAGFGGSIPGIPESLLVEPDGSVLIRSYVGQRIEHRMVDGSPAKPRFPDSALAGAFVVTRYGLRMAPDDWVRRVFPTADSDIPPTYWYLVVADDSSNGRCYFTGYNAQTRSAVGFIGHNGFTDTAPDPDEQFSVNGASLGSFFPGTNGMSPSGPAPLRSDDMPLAGTTPLLSGGRCFQVDLNRRTVRQVTEADDIVSLSALSHLAAADLDEAVRGVVISRRIVSYVLRRTNRITIFNPTDDSAEDYRLPSELESAEYFTFYLLGDHTALVEVPVAVNGTMRGERDLFWLTATGEITRQEKVTLGGWDHVPSRLEQWLLPSLAMPVPLFWSTLFFVEESPNRALKMFSDAWPGVLLVTLITLGSIALTDRKQRQAGNPRSYAWMAFVLLLGFPGFVGYLWHCRWPDPRPAPSPQRTGIEVFA